MKYIICTLLNVSFTNVDLNKSWFRQIFDQKINAHGSFDLQTGDQMAKDCLDTELNWNWCQGAARKGRFIKCDIFGITQFLVYVCGSVWG